MLHLSLIRTSDPLPKEQSYVPARVWAGLIPDNAHKPDTLKQMIEAGAVGFKAFMSPSGIDDFPNVSLDDIKAALPTIIDLNVTLMLHAETVVNSEVTVG